jgi:hypothetical protein
MRMTPRAMARGLGLASVCAGIAPVYALTIEHAHTQFENGRYELELEATLNASSDAIQRVLRNYTRYPELDARVLDAKIVEQVASNELLLYTRLRACFAFVCRGVERVERVREFDGGLEATALPGRSDVKFGLTRTELTPIDPQTTRLVYRTQIEPKFWIPRIIGRRAMLNTLRDTTVDLFKQVEIVARQPEG